MQNDDKLNGRSSNWWRVRQIAEDILASPDQDREQILRTACQEDEDLVAEVRVLLDAVEYCDVKSRIMDESRDDPEYGQYAPGDQFGPYNLRQKVGAGGFGEVWMADQVRPVKRRVAIKLIKPGMDSGQVIARFEAERQALAMMNHPNIARVFDASSSEDGQPYFVMELVNGVPITEYCDKYMLDLDARVRLVQVVCSAVQHAHQKGIIHRDLKPGNVLVGEIDGKPVVKVIDFGVAKALGKSLTEKTYFTEFRQFVGTPEYMSPEQADLSLIDVDTRSDVYTIGVMLYELLVGSPPFDSKSLRSAGFDEMRRIIREVEPDSPSNRLGSLRATGESTVFHHTMGAGRVRRLVRGELDWIVQRAMAKERDRRYSSANDLNEDLDRFLTGVPVEAGPPSPIYRMSKFVRRHRPAVGFAAVILLLILGFIGLLMWDNHRIREAKAEADAARIVANERAQEAERERAISAAVMAFLTDDMLAAGVPSLEEGQGRDITMRGMLDAASDRIEGAFEDNPAVEASLRLTIAQSYRALGLYREADPHFERAHKLWRGLLGPDAEASLFALEGRASQAAHSGNIDLARSLLEEAIDLRVKLDGPRDLETLGARHNLIYLLKFEGRYAEAEDLLREICGQYRRELGIEHEHTRIIMFDLAEVIRFQGRHAEAATIVHDILEVDQRLHGPDHEETLHTVNLLANIYKDQGRIEEASTLLTNVLSKVRMQLSGSVQSASGTVEKTIEIYRGITQVRESKRLRLVSIESNLADVYYRQGRYEKAIALFDEVLDTQVRTFGQAHPRTISAYQKSVQIRLAASRFQEAKEMLQKVIPLAKQTYGSVHVETAFLQVLQSQVLMAEGRLEEAVEQSELGLDVVTRARRDGHPDSQYALKMVREVYLAMAEEGESGGWAAKAEAIQARILPAGMLALDAPAD